MTQSSERGSTKLMHELFDGKVPETHVDAMRALGITVEQAKLLRWWIKGQPRPDWFFASFQVRPENFGDIAGRLIKAGLVVEGFPFGLPVVDGAIINATNIPAEVRG
jgi:hypothetical protein